MPSFIVRGRIIATDKSAALHAFMTAEGAKWAEVEEQMELPLPGEVEAYAKYMTEGRGSWEAK